MLFVERATAADGTFELSDANAATVAHICGKLDGIPLAVDIAAYRAAVNGIEDTARLLNDGLGLQWPGRRTALARHQSLQAMLDWSYRLLPDIERRVLHRIAALERAFTLERAQVEASGSELTMDQVVTSLDGLVAKSLVCAAAGSDGSTRYRLYGTTRLYALAKPDESGAASRVNGHSSYDAATISRLSGSHQFTALHD